jgi:hypothetical protein
VEVNDISVSIPVANGTGSESLAKPPSHSMSQRVKSVGAGRRWGAVHVRFRQRSDVRHRSLASGAASALHRDPLDFGRSLASRCGHSLAINASMSSVATSIVSKLSRSRRMISRACSGRVESGDSQRPEDK